MNRILSTISIFLLLGCTTIQDDNFCENWSTNDGSGNSVAWEPSAFQMETIRKQLGGNRKFVCAEITPSKTITVIGFYEKHFALGYKLEIGELIFVEESLFFSTHN